MKCKNNVPKPSHILSWSESEHITNDNACKKKTVSDNRRKILTPNDNGLWHTKWTDIFPKRLLYHQTTTRIDNVSDAITYYCANDIINIALHNIYPYDKLL